MLVSQEILTKKRLVGQGTFTKTLFYLDNSVQNGDTREE
jgi:hypothetical protein